MPSSPSRALNVVAYHYVRDLGKTPFGKLNAMPLDDFQRQIGALKQCFEMASLESAMAFLDGTYHPTRDLCLLTFDDGVSDHYRDVHPLLIEAGVQGVFFVVTSCLNGKVAAVHMNHFLMAALDFADYRRRFLDRLNAVTEGPGPVVDPQVARTTYRWDTQEIAEFKYLVNFSLATHVRDEVLEALFEECFGSEEAFANELYLQWDEARTMQSEGMVIGGHTHTHRALAKLAPEEQRDELETCTALLRARLFPQAVWPFSFPYGKRDSFDGVTLRLLRSLDYACAFTTEKGDNLSGRDPYGLRRVDPKDMPC